MNNNQQLVRFKHVLQQNMFKANDMVQKYWFKILLVLLVTFIITQKDLSFQFNLNTASNESNQAPLQSGVYGAVPSAQPISLTTEAEFDVVEMGKTSGSVNKKPTAEVSKTVNALNSKKPKSKSNLANTYSNIGFIVNPTYAKRHNVDPKIVAYNNKKCFDYIKRYAPVAKAEMKRYNVPASITLAQGLLESNAGESRLSTKNNNHFGIKCFSKTCKKGHCRNFTDDTHKDFFRNYSSSWESYRAHSVFLNRSRYKHLTKSTDYKKWAHGLKKAGYATDKKYANKLIKIIEVMKLYKYDK